MPLWRPVLFARRVSTQNYSGSSITENSAVGLYDFHLFSPLNVDDCRLTGQCGQHSQ